MNIVIGLTGPNGAGKTTLAEQLANAAGATHLSMRKVLSELLVERGISSTRESIRAIANELRAASGSTALADLQLQRILQHDDDLTVIESFRSMKEVMYIREKLQDTNFRFVLVAVDAPLVDRIPRMLNRKSETDTQTPLQLIEAENLELYGPPDMQSMANCLKFSDIIVSVPFDRDGSITREVALQLFVQLNNRIEHQDASPVSRRFIFNTGATRRQVMPYLHLIPFGKLEALSGVPYDAADDLWNYTCGEFAITLATMNIRPAAFTDIETMFQGNVPVPVVFLDDPFEAFRHQRMGFAVHPGGTHTNLYAHTLIHPEWLIAYEVPWI